MTPYRCMAAGEGLTLDVLDLGVTAELLVQPRLSPLAKEQGLLTAKTPSELGVRLAMPPNPTVTVGSLRVSAMEMSHVGLSSVEHGGCSLIGAAAVRCNGKAEGGCHPSSAYAAWASM